MPLGIRRQLPGRTYDVIEAACRCRLADKSAIGQPLVQSIVDSWIDESVEALEPALVSVDCLINPEAILIGGRLPAPLVERLANRLNERLRTYQPIIPSVAPIARAALADDAPAVGAAILPFTNRFLPIRLALMKNPNER